MRNDMITEGNLNPSKHFSFMFSKSKSVWIQNKSFQNTWTMLFSFFISSIVLKIENKSTMFKYEGNQKLKVKSESAAYIKFKSNLICTYYANNQQCVYLNWCQMEWTDGRWLHPCYPKCIKFVSKMKANLSLTQRDGSIHVIQTVSNCFQNENKS